MEAMSKRKRKSARCQIIRTRDTKMGIMNNRICHLVLWLTIGMRKHFAINAWSWSEQVASVESMIFTLIGYIVYMINLVDF
jgi:hypothetical protein